MAKRLWENDFCADVSCWLSVGCKTLKTRVICYIIASGLRCNRGAFTMNHYDVKATRLRRKGKNIPDLRIKPICFTRYSIARFCLLYSPFLTLPTLAPYRITARSSSPSHAPQALPPLAPHYAITRSSPPSHAPQALSNLAPHCATTRSLPPSHAPQALSPLAPRCATARSLPSFHAPQALSPLAPYHTTTRSTPPSHAPKSPSTPPVL